MGLLDLGCGDGQVVAAAARRGALAAGVEADPDLVEQARTSLSDAGLDGDIRLGDLFAPDLDLEVPGADETVLFAYLAPATLQRLVPGLARADRRRLVTVDFDVPGLTPHRREGAARLYRLPGKQRRIGAPGWPSAGTLLTVAPDCQSLACLDLVHPGGPVRARLSRNLAPYASVLAGSDHLDGAAHLAIDLRWEPMEEGTVSLGTCRVTGVEDHALVIVVTEEDGMWELDDHAVDGIRRAMRRRRPPRTLSALLDATG